MSEYNPPQIHILLASYNGAEFIIEQLDSIFSQSYTNIKVTIRDDGSTDNTIDLINGYKKKCDLDITLIENTSKQKGHSFNFSALSEIALNSQSEYFCFSDQDDVWHSNKLSLMIHEIHKLEKQHGVNLPILVHSDLVVVDERLDEIAPSFINYQGLPNPDKHNFPEFLYQNVVTGCATMFNKALLDLATPIPSCAPVHDWWFGLCAQSFGAEKFIAKPLVYYRQHGINSIGATRLKEQRSFFKKYIYKSLFKFPFLLSSAIQQAEILSKSGAKTLPYANECYEIFINDFANLKNISSCKRVMYAHDIFKNRSKYERVYLYFVFFLVKWL
ncbi:glycosyltransferase family 2 protein [Pseudoalteromonas sp. '520P1 No. 423']|nr:glycosyltransferase family 2 protein [Pseudoalteromonas sp. '520P1 No. 423']